ncbi:hypothetical protein RFI_29414 [Reticulomyxa filosa]|uniref:A-kinase anchor protein 7-like phosphoesterase domain-containing protein n=1 Tax=Reticulomyxa filosa TaxID=46433 RepID=X6M4L4_RETFI|nr:hypothetical protein RFI_29414 [Reticulomyxa filosa]|eukprot:ETO07980.1 hypothetical protein RFI_29414 [Reticulomyxa filosa]
MNEEDKPQRVRPRRRYRMMKEESSQEKSKRMIEELESRKTANQASQTDIAKLALTSKVIEEQTEHDNDNERDEVEQGDMGGEASANDPLSALCMLKPESEHNISTLRDDRALDQVIFQHEEFQQYYNANLPRGNPKSQLETSSLNQPTGNKKKRAFSKDGTNKESEAHDQKTQTLKDQETWNVDEERGGAVDRPLSSRKLGNGKGSKKCPPNYFIALRITDQMCLKRLKVLQDTLINAPFLPTFYRQSLTNSDNFHITISALHIPTDENVFETIQAFNRFGDTLFQRLVPSKLSVGLTIGGLGHFKERVVHVGVVNNDNKDKLENVFHALHTCLQQQCGHFIQQSDKFEAHITLMKLSLLGKGKRNAALTYPCKLLFELANEKCPWLSNIGVQFLNKLELCCMTDFRASQHKQEEGYYQRLAHIQPFKLT